MKENFIDLTDGTRLSVRVNFGTIYYLQKQKGFYRIQKKAEKNKKQVFQEEYDRYVKKKQAQSSVMPGK